MRAIWTTSAVLAVAVAMAGCQKGGTSKGFEKAGCPAAPLRVDAHDDPNKHAWDLFLQVNHPAQDEAKARGEPDCSMVIGAVGTTAVWETWRNAATEVFLQDGSEPPEWQDTTLPDEKPGTVPPKRLDDGGQPIRSMHVQHDDPHGPRPSFSPSDGVFNDEGGFGETRMNRATYTFIRDQCLFSVEGTQRYVAAMAAGKKPKTLSFPADSIEVKAAWLDFERQKTPEDKQSTYYTAEYKGKKYGLVALHIITKDTPNWFWASFHHKDSPKNDFERPDTHGQPKELAGTVWANYVLGGVQTDFVEPTGEPQRLSDHYVEYQFQKSSCITCHSTATISPTLAMPSGQLRALCAMDLDRSAMQVPVDRCKALLGPDAFKPGTNELHVERGVPNPKWFEKNGKPYYVQTDFVWAIPFRAKGETKAPPDRCIW